MVRLRTVPHKSVHVEIDGRRFIVEWSANGEVRRIKERKLLPEPQIGVFDSSYWDVRHHELGKGNTLPKRIIAAASAKLASS